MSDARGVSIEGTGLHDGRPSRVTLAVRPGPVALRVGEHETAVTALRVVGTVRAMTVASPDGSFRVRTVDHLFAALAGLGIRDGVCIDVDGDELPILDGASMVWCRALRGLGFEASPPRLRVARPAVIDARASRFTFAPPEDDAPDAVHARARIEFDDPRLAGEATWDGGADDFEQRIATARTFAFASEIEGLLQRGLAQHVAPESVVVIAPDAIHAAGRPFTPDEPARHKLLDLLGDLYPYGGPPLGRIDAFRPGHGATHEAMARALAEGIVVPA